MLGRLSSVPVCSAILRRFGPIGEVVLRKPEAAFDPSSQSPEYQVAAR